MEKASPLGDAAVESSRRFDIVRDSSDDDSLGVPGKEPASKRKKPMEIQSLAQTMDDEIIDSASGNFASQEGRNSFEAFYEQKSNPPKVLLAMWIGCKPGEPTFGDPDYDENYKTEKNTRPFKPTSEDLKEEVMRRSLSKKVKPKWWSRVKESSETRLGRDRQRKGVCLFGNRNGNMGGTLLLCGSRPDDGERHSRRLARSASKSRSPGRRRSVSKSKSPGRRWFGNKKPMGHTI